MDKEATIQEVHEALTELKLVVDSSDSESREKLEKLNTFFDDQETKNQTNVVAFQNSEKLNDEMKERIDAMELELSAKGNPSDGDHYLKQAEYKALNEFARIGLNGLSPEHMKALRTDIDSAGGYLVPNEMDTEITKEITEISGIRSIARVRTIGAKTLEMAKRTAIPTATYEGEGDAGDDSQSAYGTESVTAYRQTFTTPITMDMLMDSAFDMNAEIFGDATEAFANGEGANFVGGTGNKTPEGFLVNAEVVANARDSAVSGIVDATDVILLTGDLKVGYDPVYVMNRRTLAQLRTLKSTTGSFLWQPGMNGGIANTINGFQYIIANDMPDIASNSLSVAFGDFRRGYVIVDRAGTSVIRDDFAKKRQAIVEFTFNRWNTGQVVLPEAIKLLKTKT